MGEDDRPAAARLAEKAPGLEPELLDVGERQRAIGRASEPGTLRLAPGRIPDPLQDGGEVVAGIDGEGAQARRHAGDDVHVEVHDARHGEASAEIDRPRVGTGEARKVPCRAKGENSALAVDGEGPGDGAGRIHRPERTVDEQRGGLHRELSHQDLTLPLWRGRRPRFRRARRGKYRRWRRSPPS